MAFVYNATEEEQSFKAAGNWFTFKPKQIKNMNDDIATFIALNRKEHGVVVLPQEFEDLDYKNSEEGKKVLEKMTAQGVDAYISGLRAIIANNQVSLRQDLEKANIKADPAAFASDGEIAAMRLVKKYNDKKKDMEQEKINEVANLMKEIGE